MVASPHPAVGIAAADKPVASFVLEPYRRLAGEAFHRMLSTGIVLLPCSLGTTSCLASGSRV